MPSEKIVIVDDDEFMREGLLDALAETPCRVEPFADGRRALEEIADGGVSLLVTDMRMPGMDGMELLEKALRIEPDLPVVMITAFATVETAVEAMKKGAFDYIMKPFKAEEIEVIVEKALRHRRVLAENAYLRGELGFDLEDFIGESSAMEAVFEQIRRVAPSQATVFIRGESGTGKELAARAVHALGDRADRPLVGVNCAALSAGLLESELFGHEKGAFTGADSRRVGRFELAEGGVILLDEISEMDLTLQGKLLRVLQEREYERVGSSETIKADVRVIATSNRDLERSIEDGAFRRDLFYRLNVVPVVLPPLRERKSDIPLLARHFVKRYGPTSARKVSGISDAALDLLARYDWPGNVRELENIIERAVVLGRGEMIEPEEIAPVLGGQAEVASAPAVGEFEVRTLLEVEQEYVARALRHFDGHRQNTATALGISERSLRDRIKRWKEDGVDVEPD